MQFESEQSSDHTWTKRKHNRYCAFHNQHDQRERSGKAAVPLAVRRGRAVLAGILLLGISPRRRRWLSMLIVLSVIAAAGTLGCGGAGSATLVPSGNSNPSTTKGNYTFTVTGTNSVATGITASTSFTITVQ